ncbi:hypothetical protein SteCoe_13200 [Stentor coeruleus]|uniref:Uncharacterized protein n=1 Tax=Stentor coeruleus TaxID=5963 RepID=A0A1R2C8V3_9CILI|nr:hypothetical protein SteCoe_13200 [Stentor coeruleus]
MGCCESKMSLNKNNLLQNFKECIEKNNVKILTKLIESPEFLQNKESLISQLDSIICTVRGLKLNAMGYALFLGRNTIFQLLYKVTCSLSSTENLLQHQGIYLITLICSKGYSDILSFYLPLFIEKHSNDKPNDKSFTLDFNIETGPKSTAKTNYTAVQMAVQYGHISIITIINEYFRNDMNIPYELDIEYQDENTGENCALIACRYGIYPMVKFLHQKCGANFMIRNKVGESAVQIATAGSRLHPHLQYLQIIVYLVDVVGVDIKYNHEETLLLAEDKEIIEFIEKKLRVLGVSAKKIELEKTSSEPGKVHEEDGQEHIESRRFNFMTMYAVSCGDKDDSLCSSISDNRSVNSLFGSTLSEFHK